jgi:hypothetical protein
MMEGELMLDLYTLIGHFISIFPAVIIHQHKKDCYLLRINTYPQLMALA